MVGADDVDGHEKGDRRAIKTAFLLTFTALFSH